MLSLNSEIKNKLLRWMPGVAKYRFMAIGWYKKIFWFLRYLPGSSKQFGPPRGIYKDAEEYNRNNPATPIAHIVLKEGEPYRRKMPITNSALITAKFMACLNVELVAKEAFFLKDARYLYGDGGTVITNDDRIFLPGSPLKNEWEYQRHQALYLFKLPEYTKFNKVILVDTKVADDNYYHWVRDHLARFYWIKQLGLDFSEYTLIATNGPAGYNKFSIEVLKNAGFNFREWKDIKDVNYFCADELVVAPYSNLGLNGDPYTFDKAEIGFFRSLFLPAEDLAMATFDKIYLSRRRSARSSVQETELVEKLVNYDIEEVFLEDYNMTEQAYLFSKAKLIIGFHGAGFTNMYHCQPGVKVVEIFGPDFVVTNCWDIAERMELNYFGYCNDEFKQNITDYRLARFSPTVIDVNKLVNFLVKEVL